MAQSAELLCTLFTPAAPQDLYLDISGWHVFFKDVKVNGDLRLHTVVAQELGDLIQKGLYSDAEVDSLLGRPPRPVHG